MGKQQTLQTLGFFLIVLGTVFLIIGLIVLNTPIHCPANGCSSAYLSQASISFAVPFYLGVSLMVIGVALLVASKRMKFKSTSDSKPRQTVL
jgi:predicted phage tail protein